MRILLGTSEISGITPHLADGLTALGHEVTTAMVWGHENFAHLAYHFDLSTDGAALSWRAVGELLRRGRRRRPPGRRASPHERMAWLIAEHDAFIFTYTSLRADRPGSPFAMGVGREFPLLKRLGKKIVSLFLGPEVRHAEAFDQQLARLRRPTGSALTHQVQLWSRDPLPRTLRNLRRAERWSDLILSQPNQAALALRPYRHLFLPARLDGIPCHVPRREIPLVVHAPSDTAIKGTSAIVAALDALRARGVRFGLRLLHGVPHGEVMAALREADVVIDQLHLPLYGKLAVEAMASGCAVATCDRRDLEPSPAARPLVHVDPGRLVEPLRRLLTDQPLRVKLASEGRRFVERHHDHVAVARRIVGDLALAAEEVPCEHHPTFFARHYRLPPGAQVPPSLRRLTREVVARWQLPRGASLASLVARGLA